MPKQLTSDVLQLSPSLTTDERIKSANEVLKMLTDHFHGKAARSKKLYELYKYGSILLAAITTIISSLQVNYPTSFPQFILPIVSAGATVRLRFSGYRAHKKYGSIQEAPNSISRPNIFFTINRRGNTITLQRRKG